MISILSPWARPGGCRFQQALNSPLLAGFVCRFNDSVGVGDDHIAGIKLHRSLLRGRIRESGNIPTGAPPVSSVSIEPFRRRTIGGGCPALTHRSVRIALSKTP